MDSEPTNGKLFCAGMENIAIFSKISDIFGIFDIFDIYLIFSIFSFHSIGLGDVN